MLIFPFLASFVALAQIGSAHALAPHTTLPVVFPHTIRASDSRPGDAVIAETIAPVRMADGSLLPKGSLVKGHVTAVRRFVFDTTPYARQRAGTLALRFDSVEYKSVTIPLAVSMRAMADPLASEATADPLETDIDPTHTTTQVGGDQVTPWQKAVLSPEGDAVGYMHHGFVYAHLIASDNCDGTDTEEAMGIFSASACGLYGFPDTRVATTGAAAEGASFVLSSVRRSPEIDKRSTALLEVSGDAPSQATR